MDPAALVVERIVGLSTSAGARVYALKLPQRPTLRAVRVQRIGGPREQHLRGPEYPTKTRIQVDSYSAEGFEADPYEGALILAAEIRGDGLGDSATGLWGWTGQNSGSPTTIAVSQVELLHDGTPEYEAGEFRLVRVRQDFMVHWRPM